MKMFGLGATLLAACMLVVGCAKPADEGGAATTETTESGETDTTDEGAMEEETDAEEAPGSGTE